MEEIDSSVSEESNILERSYCRGVKKIIHQRNSCFFELPNHVIKKRQRAWSKLFDKYDKEIDDYEINMYSLGSDVDEDDKEIEKNSNQDTGDADEKYFVKNRTPIRKLPALVQYWVDTGNPPFQLNLENDESESSLSEDQKSSPLIIHAQSETEGKRDHSTSFLSSVDTAAYILSNTNVTTKADTLAIVEGAKKSDSPIEADNILLNASKECTSTNQISNIQDKDNYTNNVTSGRTSIYYMNGENITAIKSHLLTALDPNNIKNKKLISSENCDKSLDKFIMQTSVKITDVLPTLEQLDKTLNGNTSDIDELSNIISLKNSQKSSSNQPLSRKKLYTNRESPIDLIISNSTNNVKPRFSTNILHPALQSTPTVNASKSYFRRRTLRYSRKRKSNASNKFKRLSDKSYLNSPRIRKSNRKRSSAKSLSNSNHDTRDDNINNSVELDNDDELKNNEKEEDLVALCKKKNLFVRLEKIPDDQLTKGNIKVKDIENALNSSNIHSVKTTKSNQQISANDIDILELESQASDQSTIIICQCNDKSNSSSQQDRQTCSDNESVQTEDEHNEKSNKRSKQHIEKSTELLNEESQNIDERVFLEENKVIVDDEDDFSDVFVGKFNKVAKSSVLSEISALSNRGKKMLPKMNKSKKTEVNTQSPLSQKSNNSRNSEDQSWKLRLTFSSDEEDDFIQMIRRKSETSKFRQTQIEDKSVKDANKTKQTLNNCKNESNLPCKFEVIVSSDDDEKKIIKFDNISKQIRKSIRIHSRSKNSKSESSIDEFVKIETTSKQKRKSTNFPSKKFNKHSGKTSIKNTSPQRNTRKAASSINYKLNYSESDSSCENTTSPKKLKTTADDASNGNKNQTINDINSTNESKGHILTKKCSIPILKYLNPSEDVVDSGLSSIVSSNDKISKKISNEKLTFSDDLKSISPLEKRNGNSPKSLKRKFSMSTHIKQSSSQSVKKFTKKHKSILVTDESDSENDSKPKTRRQFSINKSNLSNPMNTRNEKNFDTIFPDLINDSNDLDITVFSSRPRRSRSQNAKIKQINQTSSNSRLRNGKIKFHTGMYSDSD